MLINGDMSLAREVEADGVHLPAGQLMSALERPDFAWVGASTHNADELAQAAQLNLDFVVLGPVLQTQSHPGTSGLGWDGFARLVQNYPLPVLAIGGLGASHMAAARAAGAHGIAGIRGVWAQ